MRIIAGSARRTELEVAAGSAARPFLEMARGALFNALGERVAGARILDVFAGSGALGLEALSRGGAACLFVESDPASCRALRGNAEKCRLSGRVEVAREDAAGCLARLAGARGAAAGPSLEGFPSTARDMPGAETAGRRVFELIFLDPPFSELAEWRLGGAREGMLRDAARLLAPGGTLVFRLEDAKVPPPEWPGLSLARERKYGRSRVCRYEANIGGL